MSTLQNDESQTRGIARSAWGEPWNVEVVGRYGPYLLIKTEDSDRVMGFPESLVIDFDRDAYEGLKEASRQSNRHRLEQRWSTLRQFTGETPDGE